MTMKNHSASMLLFLLVSLILASCCVQQSTKTEPGNTASTQEITATTSPEDMSPGTVTTLSAPPVPTTSGSKSVNIAIKNFEFSPSEVRIGRGDTLVWTNMDTTAHTVTSESGSELSSDTLVRGETYMHTFENSGVFNYHCNIHKSMKGKVIVT